MWKATVVGRNYVNGILVVLVSYTNGTNTFTEPIDMTGGTTVVLNNKIQIRLNALNGSDALLTSIDSLIAGAAPIQPTSVVTGSVIGGILS